MLTNIHPYLTGDLLRHLDAMGHSDAVVLADAHFPAERLAARVVYLPGLTTPSLLAAVRTVVAGARAGTLVRVEGPPTAIDGLERSLREAP